MTGTLPVAPMVQTLAEIAAQASARDHSASGVQDALALLERAGALAWNAVPGTARPPAADELALVRAVARADSSVGRVFDGHLNGVERLVVHAPTALRESELGLVQAGLLRVGVWGGAPRPGEGDPARLHHETTSEYLSGVVTFCSGAGILDRALVLAQAPDTPLPVSVWIDLGDAATVHVDESWYCSSGLRASASHRVVFDRAPVLARLGEPGSISAQPWFGRDALRTAASWAGMADSAVAAALEELAARPHRGELEKLAAGRILTAQRTISSWLDTGARAMDAAAADIWDVALHARVAIADAVRTLLDEAARACGSHAFATGADLDRIRRDLDLFLLQHRLEPALVRAGAGALDRVQATAST